GGRSTFARPRVAAREPGGGSNSCSYWLTSISAFVVVTVNMKVADPRPTRSYTMRARAESTTRTRERILDAVIALSEERLSLEIILADVAARAGVTVQTVLRHFGSRQALFELAQARQVTQVRAERATPVGDTAAAVRTIVAFYDRMGEWCLR